MKKLEMEVEINATREQIWDSIVNQDKYTMWTKAFNETSTFEGGWNKGDRILFVGINEDGKKEGMVSEIAESRYPEYISVRHLGFILDGVEDLTSDEVKKWAPSYENYSITSLGPNKSRFHVSLDMAEEWIEHMESMWEKALVLLQEVSESAGKQA